MLPYEGFLNCTLRTEINSTDMSRKIRIWQWPNILSLDAALIAVAWQWTFSRATGSELNAGAYLVLGLSVWMTYAADRLFDVRSRSPEQLLSHRHRLAKRHSRKLWMLWAVALIADLAIAFQFLSFEQLRNGALLLAICLCYTLLNQLLSSRFFPKELCVAAIYAGGVIVFLDGPTPWLAALVFALICCINCLMVGLKEREVDAAMQVKSVAFLLNPAVLWLLFAMAFTSLPFIKPRLSWGIGSALALLSLLQLMHRQLTVETFRVLADAALLLGAILGLIV